MCRQASIVNLKPNSQAANRIRPFIYIFMHPLCFYGYGTLGQFKPFSTGFPLWTHSNFPGTLIRMRRQSLMRKASPYNEKKHYQSGIKWVYLKQPVNNSILDVGFLNPYLYNDVALVPDLSFFLLFLNMIWFYNSFPLLRPALVSHTTRVWQCPEMTVRISRCYFTTRKKSANYVTCLQGVILTCTWECHHSFSLKVCHCHNNMLITLTRV